MDNCKNCTHFLTCKYVNFNGYQCIQFKNYKDVVEAVRCKDCKYWNHMGDGIGDCTNGRFHLDGCPDPTMTAEEFCCLGERKDNERKADGIA